MGMGVGEGAEAVNTADTANNAGQSANQNSGGGNFAGNASLIGGALDSLGLSVTGWIDRATHGRRRNSSRRTSTSSSTRTTGGSG